MTYNVKIQFVQMTIQDIDTTKTFIVEFLHKSKQRWYARKETRPKATSIDLMCIEESEEDEAKEHYFMEAQIMKDTRKENVVTQEEQIFIELQLNVQQTTKVQTMVEAQQRLMEMEQCEAKVVMKRRHTILDRATLF